MLTFEMRDGNQKIGLEQICNFIKEKIGDDLLIVEIGSYCGSGSTIIANTFKNSKLFCVDPWEKYVEDCSIYDINKQELELKEAEQIFDKKILNYNNVIKNKMASIEFAKNITNETIDFVYIDGNHQYSSVKEDIEIWKPKIKQGGIIGGHDYHWESVQRAIHEHFKSPPDKTFIDGSWLYFKN
jgi:predicted O-methyltransferase YrrM